MDVKQIAAMLGGGRKQAPTPEQMAILQALVPQEPQNTGFPGMSPVSPPDVPSRGEQRAVQMPADPALMDAERMFRSDPRKGGAVEGGQVRKQDGRNIPTLSTDEMRGVGSPGANSGLQIIPDASAPGGVRQIEIPGGAAEAERIQQEQLAQQREQLRAVYGDTFFSNLDDARGLASGQSERGGMLYNMLGGRATTGMAGELLDGVPGTAAHDLEQLMIPLQSGIAFDRLQAMRDTSPTGAALGAISDAEISLLQNSISSLNNSQSNEQFVRSLDRIEDAYNRIIHGEPPEDITMAQWREFHRQNRMAARDGGQIQLEMPAPAAGGAQPQPTHRFNPATGQIEAIQ